MTNVTEEFGIAHSIVPQAWKAFETMGTAIRAFSSGHPRATTTANDILIDLEAEKQAGSRRNHKAH